MNKLYRHASRAELQFRLLRLLFNHPELMPKVKEMGLTEEQFEEKSLSREVYQVLLQAYNEHNALPSFGVLAAMARPEARKAFEQEFGSDKYGPDPPENLDLLVACLFNTWKTIALLDAYSQLPNLLGPVNHHDKDAEEPDISEVAGKLHREITRIETADQVRSRVTIGEALAEQTAGWDARGKGHDADGRRVFPTKYLELDSCLDGGVRSQSVTIVCGRPGHGKTAVLGNIAIQMATWGRTPTCFFTLEMNYRQLALRTRSMMSVKLPGNALLPLSALRTGAFLDNPSLVARSREIDEKMARVPLLIRDAAGFTSDQLYSAIEAEKRNGYEVFVVDHFGLLATHEGKRPTKENEWAELSEEIRKAALKLDVAIIMAVQLNRDIEKRPVDARRPQLSDLRDTGKLEQDAEVVIGVYRKSEDVEGASDREFELDVLKNRDSRLVRVPLLFNPACVSLDDPGSKAISDREIRDIPDLDAA